MQKFEPPDPSPSDTFGAPTPLKASLDRVLRSLGAPDSHELSAVMELWPHVVDNSYGVASKLVSLVDNVLLVSVSDGAYASRLRWQEAEILAEFKRVLPKITIDRLQVRVERFKPE